MSDQLRQPTPGQTIGPFFGYALPRPGAEQLVPAALHQQLGAIRLTGRVLDGRDGPVPDALVEIRQADAAGLVPGLPGSLERDGYTFTGWGRCATDRTGRYSFSTVLPAPTAEGRPPFIAMVVFARGLLDRLFTRVYLPDHERDFDADPLLRSLDGQRRGTLVASVDGAGLSFDVRLQGPSETVFLRYPDG